MAIPSVPSSFYVQQGNRQVWLTWDLSATALTYEIQRSLDNITFSALATVSINNYLDTAVTVGTQYFYKVRAVNGDGPSAYTDAEDTVPTPTSEMSLGQLRLAAQQRADRVNSNFVTMPEWNSYINQSQYELYDLLIKTDPDLYVTTPASFVTVGNQGVYQLPDGITSFTNGLTNTPGYIAPPFYRLSGVDLSANINSNGWVSLAKFNFINRNQYIYPTLPASPTTGAGFFNLQYRLIGIDKMEFIPLPTGNQPIRVWYVPRLNQLLKDTDLTSTSISGWIEFVIIDAAIKALQKEESDVGILLAQKMAIIKRIEETAANRDFGQPDTISDIRRSTNGWDSGFGDGFGGPVGGF